eukprot:CAMPEP_0118934370 /NCGR_PEP_ID=MMETSP1169-20130426/13790_1 /TAXON_ID=36882 /ORGANISM="Pyramimonas obovata, Strain CCMP722" /LENGTH=127 /DNA_ID=CAMNT_0006877269 /DNA_START=91 /DNA_END=470 /DNA_ORIENTATION=-
MDAPDGIRSAGEQVHWGLADVNALILEVVDLQEHQAAPPLLRRGLNPPGKPAPVPWIHALCMPRDVHTRPHVGVVDVGALPAHCGRPVSAAAAQAVILPIALIRLDGAGRLVASLLQVAVAVKVVPR